MTRIIVCPRLLAGRLARCARGAGAQVADRLIRVMTSAVVDRLDLDALVARVDVNRVADRVDVDRVVLRVDVDAVIARVDLVVLTRDVLQAIDLGQMVRDTSGGAAEGTVAALRVRSVRADRVVNHFADRLLHRPGADPQGTDGPGPTP